MTTNATFVALAEDECLRLLASRHIGRVAFPGPDGFPIVVPVNFLLDDGLVAFRTAPGTVLDQLDIRPIAFQVDDVEQWNHSGWSVLVQGYAHDVTDAAGPRFEALRQRVLTAWAPGDRTHWIVLRPSRITGRRIVARPLPTSSVYPADPTEDWMA